MVFSFDMTLVLVSVILYQYTDKKERKKRLLKLKNKVSAGSWSFISSDILGADKPKTVLREAVERYETMVAITIEVDELGAQGIVNYQNEVYPVYLNPDCLESMQYCLEHEEEVIREIAYEFGVKYIVAPGTFGIIALFSTNGFSGIERKVRLHDGSRQLTYRESA